MDCVACEKEGKSTVARLIGAIGSAGPFRLFYDAEKRLHNHQRTSTVRSFDCKRGHYFVKTIWHKCWCSWSSEKEIKKELDDIFSKEWKQDETEIQGQKD